MGLPFFLFMCELHLLILNVKPTMCCQYTLFMIFLCVPGIFHILFRIFACIFMIHVAFSYNVLVRVLVLRLFWP